MFYSMKHDAVVTESAAEIMANDSIPASEYEDFEEGALAYCVECTENYNKLIQYIGIRENAYFAETGKEFVYTEGMISDFVEKVKNLLKKIIAKIKSLFKRLILMIDRFVASDKKFVEKYGARIKKSKVDFDFEGYPFFSKGIYQNGPQTLDGIKKAAADLTANDLTEEQANSSIEKLKEDYDRDELFKKYYGSSSKENLGGVDIDLTKAVEAISGGAKAKKDAEELMRKAENAINEIIRTIEKGRPKDMSVDGADNVDKSISNKVRVAKEYASCIQTACGIAFNAYKDSVRQARKLCAKAIVKSGKINEFAGIEHPVYEGTSFFDGFDIL